MSSETKEHKRIKELVVKALRENFGTGLNEYPDCGNVADACVVTKDGIKIFVEVVWTPTENNFNRDLNILHRSDAKVKILIANPKLLQKPAVVREFVKTKMAETRRGSVVSDMIDGSKILEDANFIDIEFVPVIRKLLDAQRTKAFAKVRPKDKLKHSKRILLTRSDYQGLDCWRGTLMKNLLLHSSKRLETECLMKHFETGYRDELWVPLIEYKKIMEKYGYLNLPFIGNQLWIEEREDSEKPSAEEERRLSELEKQFQENLSKVIFSVQNDLPLKGWCDFCPAE